MEMLAAILFTLIGLAAAQNGGAMVNNGSYMALFTRDLKSNSKFRIYFELLRPVAYETIEAHVLYVNRSEEVPKNKTLASGSLSLSSGKQEGLIELAIPDLPKEAIHYADMNLYMKGKGILNFEKMTHLYNRYWDSSNNIDQYIFIQTDKAAYKTGQTVKYRVFVLDKEMKPIDPVMTINLYDAKGNKMKEHVNVSGSFGISGELPLSEKPTLGRWTIDAILAKSGTLESVGFVVEEYVLPKYEVKVELPDFGTVANPELKGTVTAKYTYGKPVKGHVTLKVSKQGGYWWFFEPRAIQTEFEIDGTAGFSIATDTLLKFDPELKYDTLTVEANVTEKETGEVRIGSSSVTFHEKPLYLEFIDRYGDDIFKPEFKYTTYIKVSQPDKRPLPTSGERVKVSVTYFTDSPSQAALPFRPPHSPSSNLMEFISPFPGGDVIFMPDMYIMVPRDGIIKLDLDIPANVATGHIEVRIKEEKVSKNIKRFRTLSKSYLHLDMKTSFVKVGQQAEFSIRSNIRPDNRVTYHIIRGNDVVETHYTMIGSPYNPNTFYVTMTSDMIPESTILAYFYNSQHGEIVADALKFKVDRSSKHDVSLHFDKSQVSPGTNVTLSARANAGSQVFILAVDKSVLLHKTGNDITEKRVNEKLGISNSPSWKYQDTVLFQRVSADDPLGIFNIVGLEVFTDATLYDFNLLGIKLREMLNAGPIQCGESGGICSCINGGCEHDVNEYAASIGWSGSGNFASVRKFFPDTWIWANESVSSSGHVEMTATVPDTVTDWITTGFALNRESGVGFVTEPVNVTAFLPFFLSLHLPFSIVSGEVVVIQALVFNYYPHDLYVTVSLKNSSDEFMGVTVNKYGQEEETKDKVQKCILVKSNDATSAYLTIKALKIGTIDLEVEALSTRGRDTVRRQLIVRPPGKQEETNIPTLISMAANDSRPHITDIQIAYPLRIVPDSQRIQITVIGDIFGPTLDHLDQLIKIPYGCGEQNMVRFAPAVYTARYLKVTGRFTDTMRAKIEDILMKGYQRQLTYQRYDGSFSAFGDNDPAGSLWLTAFVLKTFAQASEFTYIDPNVIRKCVDFILKKQNLDGSFNTTGFVHNQALQGGGATTSKTLAAYVFLALKEVQDKNLLENETAAQNLTSAVKLALTYVQDTSSRLSDEYELAIAAYAVANMDVPGAKTILDRLERSSKMVQSDGTKHWENTVKTLEIETAAYVALLHAKLKPIDLPVLKWLIQNRSPYGGYLSTQDTVVALQALAETAALIYSTDVNMTIDFDYGGEKPKQVTVNTDNMDILQFVDVPENIRGIRMTSHGSGMALVEVGIFYNILDEERNPNFDLVVTTNGTEVDRFTLKSCARWLGIEDSGMVLMEIGFPSGFKPVLDFREEKKGPRLMLNLPKDEGRVSRKEMDHDRLVLYYDKMDEELECYTVDVVRESTIGHSQPASVRVYTYYDTGKSASKFYLPNTLKKNYICDYCGVECGCGFDPEAVPPERCYATGMMRMNNYRMFQPPILYPGQPETKTVNTVIYPDHSSSQTTIYQGKSTNERSIYPGQPVSRTTTYHGQTVSEEQHPSLPVVGRTIESVDPISMQTLRQRLQPNRWHRGSTIPVSFSGTGHFKQTFPSLEDNFPTLSRTWKITRT